MLYSFPTRYRNFIWFLIFTFTLYSMPHLEALFPYKIDLLFPEARAAEAQEETHKEAPDKQDPADEISNKKQPAVPTASVTSTSTDPIDQLNSGISFKVDDFTGAAHLSYPIIVPPGRGGLSPQLSLNYSSSVGNGWLGVGWDLSLGFIQRKGPRKGVPKYNDTLDVFELQMGGGPQELVCIANCPLGGGNLREYRLKIEGAYLKITYDVSGNKWEVQDKSGIKMWFGTSSSSRIGKVRDPGDGTDTYRWHLDRVEDPKANYMEITYFRDQDTNNTYQIYLQRIRYNGQVSGGLSHNHEILFNLESSNRPDPIYNYRGGFKSLTKKRLYSIEVKTGGNLVRKYQFGYVDPVSNPNSSNARSLLSSITDYGSDLSTLPATTFTYQVIDKQNANNRGFGAASNWSNPSAWGAIGGNYIRNTESVSMVHPASVQTDVIDMDGDALPDRVVYDRTSPYNSWIVYFNNGNGFDAGQGWPNPTSWEEADLIDPNILYTFGNHIRDNKWSNGAVADVLDINGDGLVERVTYDKGTPYNSWEVFANNLTGFSSSSTGWYNPSAAGWDDGNYLRTPKKGSKADIIDMNGDGLPDRVVYDRTSPYLPPDSYWMVYFNNGSGFDEGVSWYNPSAWDSTDGNYIRSSNEYGYFTDVIDMNGDGLPDRVVYDRTSPYDTWIVYFNNGSGFDEGVSWNNPSAWDSRRGNYIRNSSPEGYGINTDVIDMNGDGLPDRAVFNRNCVSPFTNCPWSVYLNTGNGFSSTAISWPNPSAWDSYRGNYIRNTSLEGYGTNADVIDMDGDGLPDRVVFDRTSPYDTWLVYFNKGPTPDLLSKVTTGIGGSMDITYAPSTDYVNTFLPFIVQTVNSYIQKDGRGNSYLYRYEYSGGFYASAEVEFRGFNKVTTYQMRDSQYYESKTDTWFHQDYYKKGKVYTQILTSKEGHTRRVDNSWDTIDVWNADTKFSRLTQTISTIKDYPSYSFTHQATYAYDTYLNVSEEHKYGSTPEETIHTYFSYTNLTTPGILSKPTDIMVKNSSLNIVSRKWMDYDSSNGNLMTEEVCKSDTPASSCTTRNSIQNSMISYQYDTYKNLWKITDPRGYLTTITYDSTKTHVYETMNSLGHKTTTEYDPGTGNLKKLIPPHLQGTAYSINYTYDGFGRKTSESRPDGGSTSYQYLNFGSPTTQYIEKKEHIVGGPSVIDHYGKTYFDGMGRTYWVSSTGPGGKSIITEIQFDNLGRVWKKSNPRFSTETRYDTVFTYDGLSRIVDTLTPDNYHILTTYQGLKKIVTDQRGYSTTYTNDIYQRLKKVEDANKTPTEYSYDTLGNLIQVIVAKGKTEQNTTTMTYDSLSKKRSMIDPDMGYWTYQYDKSGNLTSQADAKNQNISFQYDGLNRLTQKIYPDRIVTYTYDDTGVLYSRGKLTKVSDPSGGETKEDSVLEYDLMQRVKRSKKKIGAEEATIERTYDSAGRAISITYPGSKIYSYEYDVAGNLLYIKDNATGNHLVDYSDYTALSQPKYATFPKPSNVSVKTSYTYDPPTSRLKTLLTQKLVNGSPTDTYQNLDYQQFDGKGNILTLADKLNGVSHTYTYDSLDRLLTAKGNNGSTYNQRYTYDRIGNITYKSDVGYYSYTYSNKPHAVRTAGSISLQYNDANGNMTQRVANGITLDFTYTCDNKPSLVKKNSTNYIQFTYDGNGERVKKDNYTTGQTVLYLGDAYEVRGGVGVLHLFAGSKRVASVWLSGNTQFYHTDHLGSSTVITDQNGLRKERNEYFPYGTYRESLDYDANFPDAFYTFTGQEEDDDLGLYNYKARLYDPVIGRFITPDRLVPDPGDPQALNRYTYCLNNPLIYTDPNGDFPWPLFIFAVLVAAHTGASLAAVNNQNVLAGGLIGAAIGAISFGVGYGIGGVVTSWLAPAVQTATNAGAVSSANIVGAMAGGFAGGAVAGGLNAAVNGGNVWQGALYGGLIGAAFAGTVAGAIELNNWVNNSGIGGPQGQSKLKLPGEKPQGVSLPELDLDYLFDYGTRITGDYLEPRSAYSHEGLDVQPNSPGKVPFGTKGSSPANITITKSTTIAGYGDVIDFTVKGYSSDLTIRFGHSKLLNGLKVGQEVSKGSQFFKLTATGSFSGAHTHIEVLFGGYKWDPRIIFFK